MRRKSGISLGPGAPSIILIFVVLSMAALGMLSLMTARSDRKLSERSAEVIEAVYRLNARAEERAMEISEAVQACAAAQPEQGAFLEALSSALPEGVVREEDLLCWQEVDESRVLDCAMALKREGERTSVVWRRHNLTSTIAEMEEFE